MRIVFLDFDDIHNPLLGAGQARATLEVGKRLAQKGHEITVISSRYPKSKDRLENGINYKHIGLGTKNLKLNNLVYILVLPLYVIKIKADIIIECFTAPISTLFSPLFTKIPVVALPTCFEAEVHSRHYHLPFYLAERFGLRFYKYFLPYTKFDEERMKKYNPKIISRIVPEGVDEEFFQIQHKNPEHILFLGRFDIAQKGIDLLLEAYAKIANKIKYPLVIAGHGPDEKQIYKLIEKLDLGQRVKIVGPVYGQKKNDLISQALFVAMPSRYEGFSLFALEVMAAGVPILCFDIHGFSWMDNNSSFRAKAFNIDEYAAQLLQASENKTQLNEKAKNSVTFAKKYTWNNVAQEFESFFMKILNKEENINNLSL